jgi:hypothetical protein
MDSLLTFWKTRFGNSEVLSSDKPDVDGLSKRCRERFLEWKKCKLAENDDSCNQGVLGKYHSCVKKLNNIRIQMDNQDRLLRKISN